jgi:UDP-N-acetylglucosamine--N-acetylmuramyl-(pentapeptide) pyrophosphoryl-undecaprenol N-acetylglucosamine transferase
MRIIIAGGGTGGHLFPALALAEAFKERDAANEILFVGSRRGLEASVLGREGFALQTIDVVSLKGKSLPRKAAAVLALPRSIFQSLRLLRLFRPDIVLGVGGYASGPVVLTASLLGYKTAIQEQNSLPGLSNRVLAKFVDRIFASFPDSGGSFPAAKTIVAGNPVRKKLQMTVSPTKNGGPEFTLFVFGGSQGAHRLNEALVQALDHLQDRKTRLRVIHQTGEKDLPGVRDAYERQGFRAEVQPFIHDMERAYRAADLVLCRAGATTLFELMAMRKAAVLVPYPFAADNHQFLNARALVDAGAAEMVADKDLTGAGLAGLLRQFMDQPERRRSMEEKITKFAKPRAAETIVAACGEMVQHG